MTTAQIVLSIIYFVVADTFLSKNKAKSADARLARMTKWIAIVFMLLTLALCLVPAAA